MRPVAHPSSLALDQLALSRLEGEARAHTEAHLAACARCRDHVAEARAHAHEFCDRVLQATRGRLLDRLRQSGAVSISPVRRFALWLAPALAAAAALAFFVWPSSPTVIAKGGAVLGVTARHDGRTFIARDGQRLSAGDQIQFAISGAREAFVLVASIDGEGRASVYFPADGEASAPLPSGPRVELPDAVRLDHASGPERIFVLLSARPLAASQARAALTELGQKGASAIRQARTLAVPPGGAVEQLSFLVEKTP